MVSSNLFTQDDIRNAKIPSPKSPPITMVSGETIDIEEEISKNQYTVIMNLDPSSDSWGIVPSLIKLYNANQDKGLSIITCYDNNISERDRDRMESYDKIFKEMLISYDVPWNSFIRHMYDSDPSAKEGKTSPFYAKYGLQMYPQGEIGSIIVIGPDRTVHYTTLVDRGNREECQQLFLEYISEVMETPVVRYESKDYSADGRVTELQKASVGKGIDLVITGDGYSDRLIADGTFSKAAQQALSDFFSIEPYKSLRDRFNVYRVDAVSKNEEFFNGASTALSAQFVGATKLVGDNTKALEYAAKAIDDSRMDDVVVIVLSNSGLSGGTCYMMDAETDHYAGGSSVAWIPYKNISIDNAFSMDAATLIHEACGHGFGKLCDEYSLNFHIEPSQDLIDSYKERHKMNWYVNVDVTDNPEKVLWSRYINDERFAEENIGVYKGGATYYFGFWRATENSIMKTNYLNNISFFNAPSRAQIYTRIMKLSEGESWEFDYETFAEWDIKHRNSVASPSAVRLQQQSVAEELEHGPPVVVGKTWRQVMKK